MRIDRHIILPGMLIDRLIHAELTIVHRIIKEPKMPQDIFTDVTFEAFDIPDLATQMPIVRREIQPLFRYYGRILANHIDQSFKAELPIYIAKHIQRKVKPLRHTWVALGGDNRGYKKYPHFEIGINRHFIYIT